MNFPYINTWREHGVHIVYPNFEITVKVLLLLVKSIDFAQGWVRLFFSVRFLDNGEGANTE